MRSGTTEMDDEDGRDDSQDANDEGDTAIHLSIRPTVCLTVHRPTHPRTYRPSSDSMVGAKVDTAYGDPPPVQLDQGVRVRSEQLTYVEALQGTQCLIIHTPPIHPLTHVAY
jgi:hypothetical protein